MTPPDDVDVVVHTPGDDDMRLLTKMGVTTGKTVRLDREEHTAIVALDFTSRSLADADEVERCVFSMHYAAARWLRDEIDRVLRAEGQA